jgi:tetratricopeptide (TPR) repeat protein
MFRTLALPLFTLATLIPLVAGCGRLDRPKTTSASAGANTPVVSASSTESTGNVSTVATPVTYAQAESTFSAGRYPEATQLFTTYTESNSENPWGYYMLGLSAWRSGEPDRAVSAFDKALELDPNHRKSLFNSSRVLLETGRPEEALERIEKALTLEPISNEGLRLLGRARHQLGKMNEAIEAYHRALVLDDRDVWSMNNLGLIYIEQDRSSEALPPLARAVELRNNAPVFQNNLGMALERAGYPTAAAEAYEAAIAVDSTYQKASVGLARVTGGSQQPESEAIDLIALSQRFQADIEAWRGMASVSDSTETPAVEVTDSTAALVQPVSDSSRASVEAVSDTLEDCVQED